MNTKHAFALATAVPILGASMALGFATDHHVGATTQRMELRHSEAPSHTYASTDDGIAEDSPEWDCVSMGNRVCGPDNAQGKPAGRYDDGGVLITPWPVNCAQAIAFGPVDGNVGDPVDCTPVDRSK